MADKVKLKAMEELANNIVKAVATFTDRLENKKETARVVNEIRTIRDLKDYPNFIKHFKLFVDYNVIEHLNVNSFHILDDLILFCYKYTNYRIGLYPTTINSEEQYVFTCKKHLEGNLFEIFSTNILEAYYEGLYKLVNILEVEL